MTSLCVNPDNPTPWNVKSKEFITTLTGGLVCAAAAVALTAFLISVPPDLSVTYIVSYSLVGSVALAGFVTFVVGMILYSRKQKQEREDLNEELNHAPIEPIKIDEVVLDETDAPSSASSIDEARKALPPLFDAIEYFFEALVIGYCKSVKKKPQGLDKVHRALGTMRREIEAFLQNPREILRAAVGMSTDNLIDQSKLSRLLSQSNEQIIAGLAHTLSVPEGKLKAQGELTKKIVEIITSRANKKNKVLNAKIDALKKAQPEDRQAALIAVVGSLYDLANLPDENIATWTAHLVPPFLEQWRTSLFPEFGNYVGMLNLVFKTGGFFNDEKKHSEFTNANRMHKLSRPYVREVIAPMIAIFPVTDGRKKVLVESSLDLFYATLPTSLSLFDKKSAYRARVERIFNSSKCTKPEVKGETWKAYSEAYVGLFKTIADDLKA